MKNKSEKLVRDYLIKNGFIVSDLLEESANGVDLVAIKNGKTLLIEVKSAIYGSKSVTIKPVLKSGKLCNTIAMVFKNNTIIIQPMSEHLKLCSKSGSRGVTELAKLREMIIAGIETGDVM